MARLVGIDFSGSADQWRAGRASSNVWIALAHQNGGGVTVVGLGTVQQLPGSEHPFERLSHLTNTDVGATCAIDAPFSVPQSVFSGTAAEAWRRVAELPCLDRPFPTATALIETFAPNLAPRGRKIMRLTEAEWRGLRVNVRSTMWAGPRGGAAFAAACMRLLSRHRGPVWPVRVSGHGAVLCEAFPAAQLRQWGQPHQKYNGSELGAVERRRTLLTWMRENRGLEIAPTFRDACESSADALDAVICLYAAAALASDQLATVPAPTAQSEGWIAVHV